MPAVDVIESLKSLGSPDELRDLAAERSGSSPPLPANSHIHLPPNFSAFDNVQQALSLAGQQKIAVLGVSNYYDYQVYSDFGQRAWADGIFTLFGLEIICMQSDLRDSGVRVNDPGNPGKTYLCGKGISRFFEMTTEATRLLQIIRDNDRQRIREMIAKVGDCFSSAGVDLALDEAAVIEMVVRRHGSPRETVYLQERHISQAFEEKIAQEIPPEQAQEKISQVLGAPSKVESGDSVGQQNEIRSHLMKAGKPAFVEEAFLSFEEARKLILELGGIPAYPTLFDGASPLNEFEADIDKLIETLQSKGVHAAEWIPIRNSVALVREYAKKMRAAGILQTCGTEHNTLDLIPLMPFCKDGPLDAELEAIFWEGVCVVAAHQFLTAHGECGYVDADGKPNPAYSAADERIRELARLGETVIEKSRESCQLAS